MLTLTRLWRLTLGLVIYFTFTPFAKTADVERGRLLYENHCLSCHESVVHVRDERQAKSLGEIYWQTTRWAIAQKLEWHYEDVRDVAQHLNSQFYKFNPRVECE